MSIYYPEDDPCPSRRVPYDDRNSDPLPPLEFQDLQNPKVFAGIVQEVHTDGSMEVRFLNPEGIKRLRKSQLVTGAMIPDVPWPVTVRGLSFESLSVVGWITPDPESPVQVVLRVAAIVAYHTGGRGQPCCGSVDDDPNLW